MKKMCINWKVVGVLALVALAVFALAPNLVGVALPLLVVAACPLSMLVMMWVMLGGRRERAPDPTLGETEAERTDHAAELARLRAEVDQLRAERAENESAQGGSTSAN